MNKAKRIKVLQDMIAEYKIYRDNAASRRCSIKEIQQRDAEEVEYCTAKIAELTNELASLGVNA